MLRFSDQYVPVFIHVFDQGELVRMLMEDPEQFCLKNPDLVLYVIKPAQPLQAKPVVKIVSLD